MNYIEITCTFPNGKNTSETSEIAMALLADSGFESFEESDAGLKAYIPEDKFDAEALSELTGNYPSLIASVEVKHIKEENWNQVWESNFPPAEITERCIVYAPFHTDIPDREYRICIMPQMSFGTGHHETTSLMMELMLDLDLEGKDILDMGCGTGILGIFASMKKARRVTAIDTDERAYENAIENCVRNHVTNVEILQGDKRLLPGKRFDVIFANINRNILMEDISTYADCLPIGGLLQLSGFYVSDFSDITDEARKNGLEYVRRAEKKDWTAVLYRKIGVPR